MLLQNRWVVRYSDVISNMGSIASCQCYLLIYVQSIVQTAVYKSRIITILSKYWHRIKQQVNITTTGRVLAMFM